MTKNQKSKAATIAMAAAFAILLSSCSSTRYLQMTNTCDQRTTVGIETLDSTEWVTLDKLGEREIDVSGMSEIKLSINPGDERDGVFFDLDLNKREWVSHADSPEFSELRFKEISLCP